MKQIVKVHPMWIHEEESLMTALHMLVTASNLRGIPQLIPAVEKIIDLIKERDEFSSDSFDGSDELGEQGKTVEDLVQYAKTDGPFPKKDGFKWQLDGTNDWFAEIENGALVIGSRYGGDKFETLCRMVEVWMA